MGPHSRVVSSINFYKHECVKCYSSSVIRR